MPAATLLRRVGELQRARRGRFSLQGAADDRQAGQGYRSCHDSVNLSWLDGSYHDATTDAPAARPLWLRGGGRGSLGRKCRHDIINMHQLYQKGDAKGFCKGFDKELLKLQTSSTIGSWHTRTGAFHCPGMLHVVGQGLQPAACPYRRSVPWEVVVYPLPWIQAAVPRLDSHSGQTCALGPWLSPLSQGAEFLSVFICTSLPPSRLGGVGSQGGWMRSAKPGGGQAAWRLPTAYTTWRLAETVG